MRLNIHRQRNPSFWEEKGRIPLWLIAERLAVHENTLNRWLRAELEPEKLQHLLTVMNEIKKEEF